MDEKPWLLLLMFALAVQAVRAGTPMHKVTMTQRGYIQFLKWNMPVLEIEEFTFCLWIESTNLTLVNYVFSYSRNESERLVSSWISSGGRSIHLEIGGVEIFSLPANIRENRWYHLCQTWDSRDGRFALWIDGRVELEGQVREMAGHVIPGSGDIVIGQEYTNFNKGLEEGLEGSILGFNLLLASVFRTSHSLITHLDSHQRLFFSPEDLVYRRSSMSTVRSFPSFRMAGSLGQFLVRTTYEHCEIGRGSPFIHPEVMLISWTRTPVQVFGGATLKNVVGTCGRFA